MYDTIVDEAEYTTLQDDGCPNCPEHLGDLIQSPDWDYSIRINTGEWINIDQEIFTAITIRDSLFNSILKGQSKWLESIH